MIDKIIGQDKPLKLVRGLLSDLKRFPKVLVVSGPVGIGKTMLIESLSEILDQNQIQYVVGYDPKLTSLIETKDFNSLSQDIRSRACHIHFNKICQRDAIGFLMAYCSNNNIKYVSEGINRIVRTSRGDLRQALMIVETLSKMGRITKELVLELEGNVDEICYRLLSQVIQGNLDYELEISEHDMIDRLFTYYSKCHFDYDESLSKEEIQIRSVIKSSFPDVEKMTSLFLKWSKISTNGCFPLFLYELSKLVIIKRQIPTTVSVVDKVPAPESTGINFSKFKNILVTKEHT